MLTRQKLLLTMLAAAERPVDRKELTKWAFPPIDGGVAGKISREFQ